MLLDFGAARQTLRTDLPKLYPMYTPGFAAPELYEKNGSLGPWTDIYSIGAAMFACMAGAPPQPTESITIRKARAISRSFPRPAAGLAPAPRSP